MAGSNIPSSRSRMVNPDGTPTPVWFQFLQLVYRALGAGANFTVDNVMLKTNNLSDVTSAATARSNLGSGATGDALFTSATAAAALSTLGITEVALKNQANVFTAAQSVELATVGVAFTLQATEDGATQGPIFDTRRVSASAAAGDRLGSWRCVGNNDAATPEAITYFNLRGFIADQTDGSEDGAAEFLTMQAGVLTVGMTLGLGLQVGAAPTGGDKGAGTINLSGDIYKNNTAYTNPDYVFEAEYGVDTPRARAYAGRLSIGAMEKHVRERHHLPGLPQTKRGAFERQDWLLEKLEEAYLYIIDLHHRVEALERRPRGN